MKDSLERAPATRVRLFLSRICAVFGVSLFGSQGFGLYAMYLVESSGGTSHGSGAAAFLGGAGVLWCAMCVPISLLLLVVGTRAVRQKCERDAPLFRVSRLLIWPAALEVILLGLILVSGLVLIKAVR